MISVPVCTVCLCACDNNVVFFRLSRDTPLPTPTHRFNAWANDRKSLGITPHSAEEDTREGDDKNVLSKAERLEWEEDQKVRINHSGPATQRN